MVFELSTTNAFINFSLTNLSTEQSVIAPQPWLRAIRNAADPTQADGF